MVGYVFTTRDEGIGYYLDSTIATNAPQSLSREAVVICLCEAIPASEHQPHLQFAKRLARHARRGDGTHRRKRRKRHAPIPSPSSPVLLDAALSGHCELSDKEWKGAEL